MYSPRYNCFCILFLYYKTIDFDFLWKKIQNGSPSSYKKNYIRRSWVRSGALHEILWRNFDVFFFQTAAILLLRCFWKKQKR